MTTLKVTFVGATGYSVTPLRSALCDHQTSGLTQFHHFSVVNLRRLDFSDLVRWIVAAAQPCSALVFISFPPVSFYIL